MYKAACLHTGRCTYDSSGKGIPAAARAPELWPREGRPSPGRGCASVPPSPVRAPSPRPPTPPTSALRSRGAGAARSGPGTRQSCPSAQNGLQHQHQSVRQNSQIFKFYIDLSRPSQVSLCMSQVIYFFPALHAFRGRGRGRQRLQTSCSQRLSEVSASFRLHLGFQQCLQRALLGAALPQAASQLV